MSTTANLAAEIVARWRADPNVVSADWNRVTGKLERVKAAAARGKLACVADFDRTLSVAKMPDGKSAYSSHGVIEHCGFLPEAYHICAKALFEKYYPIEMSATISEKERYDACVAWWTQAHELLITHGLTKDKVKEAVGACHRVALREGFDKFLSLLRKCHSPLLIFSAGFGPVIESVLQRDSKILDQCSVSVVANRAVWDKMNGRMIGFESPLVHSCNKGAVCLESGENEHFTAALELCKNMDAILLMGDGFGDSKMAVGLNASEILKVGFANFDPDPPKMQKYLELFDVVLLGDPSLEACCHIVDMSSADLPEAKSSSATHEKGEHSQHLSEIEAIRAKWPYARFPCTRSNPSVPGSRFKLIHFVRHGQGYHNKAAEKTGCTCNNGGKPPCPYRDPAVLDAHLTELGQRQAAENVAFTSKRHGSLQAVFVSPLTRAIETALLAFGHVGREVPFISVESLREQYGMHVCDRRRAKSIISAEFPQVDFSHLETEDDVFWTEDRELKSNVAERGNSFLNFLKSRNEQEVGVVAHSSFLLTMFNIVLDCSQDVALESWFKTGELRSVWVDLGTP